MSWISNLIVKITGDNKGLDKSLDNSGKSLNKFGSTLKAIGGAIAAAFSVGVLVNFGKEALALASKAEGVKTAFDRLNAPGFLEGLRAATRGTVTDLQLMQKAVQAKNFKIPLSQLATYFEFATKRAIQTGESVDYLVDSIITGIGRKSVLVMDNLGISAVELQKEVAKVGDFGIASGNIIRRELESMGDVADTTATRIASISVALSTLKEGIGTKIAEAGWFKGITTWINNVGTALKSNLPFAEAYAKQTGRSSETLKEYNEGLAENASLLLKQREQLAAINELRALKKAQEPINKVTEFPGLTGLPGQNNLEALQKDVGILSPGGDYSGDKIKEFSDMQVAIMDLSSTFSRFFSDVNLGFEGMIEGVITGIKRLVAELIAKAVFLTLLSAITGVPLTGEMFKSLMFGGSVGSLIGGGAIGGGASSAVGNVSQGMMTDQLLASVTGKQLDIVLRRGTS